LTDDAARTVGGAWGEIDDVAVEITPHKWRSWDSSNFRDLGEQAAEGLSSDRWWRGPD
jgi:hypothetical protein